MSDITVEFTRDVESWSAEIKRLLVTADEEFIPPLSGRDGTTQTTGLDDVADISDGVGEAIEEYYRQCIDQQFILAHEGDHLAGFLSFRHDYRADALGEYTPANYISTIIVDPQDRRQGIARRMYETLLRDLPDDVRLPYVTTRTWSTNEGHLQLLDELGFENIHTIPDDRGEGIDTVYYGISVNEWTAD